MENDAEKVMGIDEEARTDNKLYGDLVKVVPFYQERYQEVPQ